MTAALRLLGASFIALLLLMFLVLLLPARVDLLYEKGVVHAGVRVLGVRIPLLPKRRGKSLKGR